MFAEVRPDIRHTDCLPNGECMAYPFKHSNDMVSWVLHHFLQDLRLLRKMPWDLRQCKAGVKELL